jgi:hypothetical protein
MYDINDINEWAENFAFDQLNSDKRAMVISEMSEEEYMELYDTLSSIKGFLVAEQADLEPDESSFEILKERLDEKKKPVFLAGIFALRIPAYQAVAACFLMMLCTYFLFGNKETQTVVVEKEVPIYEMVRDTVFREVPVVEYVTKTIVKNAAPAAKTTSITTTHIPDMDYSMRQEVRIPNMSDISKSFGNTAVNAESLEKFKVRM